MPPIHLAILDQFQLRLVLVHRLSLPLAQCQVRGVQQHLHLSRIPQVKVAIEHLH
jgi:hypothetical protein